jgi:hypothetical protein
LGPDDVTFFSDLLVNFVRVGYTWALTGEDVVTDKKAYVIERSEVHHPDDKGYLYEGTEKYQIWIDSATFLPLKSAVIFTPVDSGTPIASRNTVFMYSAFGTPIDIVLPPNAM